MKREFIVGVVFTVLLGLLVIATIWIEKPGFFDSEPPFKMNTKFREVAGLKVGDEVWVYGTTAGRVAGIQPDGEGRVDVRLELEYDPKMRENALVKITPRSALGGSIVSIHPGSPPSPLVTKDVYVGLSVADPFQEVSTAIGEMKGPIMDAVTQVNKVFGDFGKRSDAIAEDLKVTMGNLRKVSDDMRDGKSTIGKLLAEDTSLYDDLDRAVAKLNEIGDAASKEKGKGKGTIALLLHDETMAENLSAAAKNIRDLSDDVAQGRGTVGKLFKDDTLYTRLDKAVTDIGAFAADARSSEGLLGKLVHDKELAKRFDTITEDIAQVTGKLRRSEGTLGKLINDDTVYNDIRATLKKLGSGADDVRENAPVLTFAGFLFSGF